MCSEMIVDFNPWVKGSTIPRQCKRTATHGDYCWQHKDRTYISDDWEAEATHKLTHDGTNPNCDHCNEYDPIDLVEVPVEHWITREGDWVEDTPAVDDELPEGALGQYFT